MPIELRHLTDDSPSFELCRVAQFVGLVRPFLGELGQLAPEMTAGDGLAVAGPDQVQHLGDTVGPQVEVLAHQHGNPLLRDSGGVEGVDGYRGRLGHTDGVGDLDLVAVRQPRSDDVLGHVTPSIGGGAVDLGGILAR